jgi:CRISPR system Cascade subunit CasE
MKAFHMMDLRIRTEALVRFLSLEGISWRYDEDLGYGSHAWLAAVFGKSAPKPFRIFPGREHTRILGYSDHDRQSLLKHAQEFALPSALEILDEELLATKPMPDSWREGQLLKFEVLVCPTGRIDKRERDIFLMRVDEGKNDEKKLSRDSVYSSWLASQIQKAASLESSSLQGFRLLRMARRTQSIKKDSREPRFPTYPHALMRGIIKIKNPVLFSDILRRGIGRHRSFGYGMMLLRSAS